MSKTLPPLVDVKTAAAEFGLTENEVRVIFRKLPKVDLGVRRVYVRREDIEKRIQSGRRAWL